MVTIMRQCLPFYFSSTFENVERVFHILVIEFHAATVADRNKECLEAYK